MRHHSRCRAVRTFFWFWWRVQDMPEAKSVQEVADALDLTDVQKRVWYIQACSASNGVRTPHATHDAHLRRTLATHTTPHAQQAHRSRLSSQMAQDGLRDGLDWLAGKLGSKK